MTQKLPKILAMYLPQFHETPHNNEWWGEGFTEWTAVKQSQSYFSGHQAPWQPLNNNYYDLNKYETMKWQADLAKEYGIDGFCFYHYYFENGQLELEKPAENLLKWTDIDLPFCFNWANEPWIRSWSKLHNGNVWMQGEENSAMDNDGILAKQAYGSVKEWLAHFEYLLPFFKDERYIKVGGQPVFIFYNPEEIDCLEEMIECWQEQAKINGFPGLYLIGTNMNTNQSALAATLIHEPKRTLIDLMNKNISVNQNGVTTHKYSDIWEKIIKREPYIGSKSYYMGILGYDDTPRRGKKGTCLTHRSPAIFKDGMRALITKSLELDNELLFVNAWNEWGEGMYLEPDSQFKYDYLNAVKELKTEEYMIVKHDENRQVHLQQLEEINRLQYDAKKFYSFMQTFNKWLDIQRHQDHYLFNYFSQRKIHTIAIYGMSVFGKQLYDQLNVENMKIAYGIDRFVSQYKDNLTIYHPDEHCPEVDAVIVTTFETKEVCQLLIEKGFKNIFILDEIIDEIWQSLNH